MARTKKRTAEIQAGIVVVIGLLILAAGLYGLLEYDGTRWRRIAGPRPLDATRFGKETIFDFKRHRRIEHYQRITDQTGATPPSE